MGTPIKSLELLVPKREITVAEWHQLIEIRREMIAPSLNHFTMYQLSEIDCLRTHTHLHNFSIDNPSLHRNGDLKPDLQGIFSYSVGSRETIPDSGFRQGEKYQHVPNGKLFLWGLSRQNSWILVQVDFMGQAGYKDRGYERAYLVTITQVPLEVMIEKAKIAPVDVWRKLGASVRNWKNDRENLLEIAQVISNKMSVEELLIEFTQSL